MVTYDTAANWAAWGTWTQVAIYVVVALVAWWQVVESRNLRIAQARPFVVAEVPPGMLMELVIKNIGATVARDVTFEFPVALETTNKSRKNSIELAPILSRGVKVLPPGTEYRIFIDSTIDRLADETLPKEYEVIVRYRDEFKTYTDEYTLDLEVMNHTRKIDDPLGDIARAAKDLANKASAWTDGSSGLLVHARDKDAMIEELNAEWERRFGSGAGDAEGEEE